MLEHAVLVPPDGGWGWLVVLGSFVANAMTYGAYVTYPLFFMPLMSEFEIGLGQVTWLTGTFEIGKAFGYLVSTSLCSKFGYRCVSFGTTLASSLSISIAFLSNNVLMAYILVGVIPGFTYAVYSTIGHVVVSRYFEKKRAFALGLAQVGSAIGTLSLSPLLQYFIDFYTWRGAFLVLGGLSLHSVVASTLFRPIRLATDEESKTKSVRETFANARKLFVVPKFWLICTILPVLTGAWRIQLTFLVPFAQSLSVDPILSSALLSIYGVVSIFSRLAYGAIGDLKGVDVALVQLLSQLCLALVTVSTWFVKDFAGLVAITASHSLLTGGIHVLYLPIIVQALGINNVQWTFGFSGFAVSVVGAGLMPLVGMMVDIVKDMRWAFVTSAVLTLVCTLLHIPLLRKRKIG